jgi:hypothetical protein
MRNSVAARLCAMNIEAGALKGGSKLGGAKGMLLIDSTRPM